MPHDGCCQNTVTKLLVDLSRACAEYQDGAIRNLTCQRFQCDEIWAFCYSKQKNVPPEHEGQYGYGDVWTFTGICADCKIVASYLVGERNEMRRRVLHQGSVRPAGEPRPAFHGWA